MSGVTPLLSVESLSLSYGRFKAVDNASFSLGPGQVLGLCGHNGAGKSSLVRMLSGLIRPDEGRIVLDGVARSFTSVRDAQGQGLALVDQELSVIPALTVAENLALCEPGLGLLGKLPHAEARLRLDAVGLEKLAPDTLLEDLSIGERQLVEIARAMGRQARLFILDEPTATLNAADIAHVFAAVRKVAARGCGVIYVSHRLDEVLELCDRIVVMRDGMVVAAEPARGMDTGRLVMLMLGHAPPPVPLAGAGTSGGTPTLIIENLTAGPALRGFDLKVRPGMVMGIAGQVGSGASNVLRALGGLTPEARGHVTLAGKRLVLGDARILARAGIGFLSSDRKGEGLFLSRPIDENLVATRLESLSPRGILPPHRLRAAAWRIAARLGIGKERLGETVAKLSGGNQQKTFLGRCLERSDVLVLLLDEPTRGVDVGGRAEIHTLIRSVAAQGVVVMLASSDLDEVLSLADEVIVMRGGRAVSHVPRKQTDTVRLLSDMTHVTAGLGAQ